MFLIVAPKRWQPTTCHQNLATKILPPFLKFLIITSKWWQPTTCHQNLATVFLPPFFLDTEFLGLYFGNGQKKTVLLYFFHFKMLFQSCYQNGGNLQLATKILPPKSCHRFSHS
jgi:hypothetical protein